MEPRPQSTEGPATETPGAGEGLPTWGPVLCGPSRLLSASLPTQRNAAGLQAESSWVPRPVCMPPHPASAWVTLCRDAWTPLLPDNTLDLFTRPCWAGGDSASLGGGASLE